MLQHDTLAYEAQELARNVSDGLLVMIAERKIDLNKFARAQLRERTRRVGGEIACADKRCPTCANEEDIWFDLKGSAVCGKCGTWLAMHKFTVRKNQQWSTAL